ncbi:MAG TPA: NUDIX domain-containing protein [Planktothrix sp.]|jgi:8-oxo-dGTP diphosphatase
MDISGLIIAAFVIVLVVGALGKRPGSKHALVIKVFGQRPKGLDGFDQLVAAASPLGVQLATSNLDLPPGVRVLITGSPTAQELKNFCALLKEKGSQPLVIRDAVTNFDELVPVLEELNEHQLVQIHTSQQQTALLTKHGSQYLYAFPKADSTATTVIFFEQGKKVLVIKRKFNPFKGWMTLPGGFLDVLLENLYRCGARELMEEVFARAHEEGRIVVTAADLQLVDVRSEPDRDPRGHVIDHGFVWLVPADREAAVMAEIDKGDDAAEVWLEDTKVVLEKGLAFDHIELLKAAIKLLGIKLD